jgi:hypothetical protein
VLKAARFITVSLLLLLLVDEASRWGPLFNSFFSCVYNSDASGITL